MLTIKEQRKALMESMLIPGPKPYIVAAYDYKPLKRKRKLTDAEKGLREAYLYSLSQRG